MTTADTTLPGFETPHLNGEAGRLFAPVIGSDAGVESGDNTVTCERCGGQGWYPAFDGHGNEIHQEQCEACYGTGRVEQAKPQPND